MNFISRNLGWILLFLFFLFMLFIISTNQKKDNEVTLSGATGAIQVSTGEMLAEDTPDNELDKLIEKITEEEALVSQEAEVGDKENEENESTVEKKKSIFDIFKRKDTQEEVDTETGSVEDSKKEDTQKDEAVVSQEDTPQEKDSISSDVKIISNSGQGLTKTTGMSKALVAAPVYFDTPAKKESIHLPGTKLKTQVGKEFQVGVTALKLNNKSFTEKLAYMSRGDRLKQLTQENKIGCFQVEILSSSTKSNVGKIGYVCKKYLSDISEATSSINTLSEAQNSIINEIQEKEIGEKQYFKPTMNSIELTDRAATIVYTTLDTTDILVQISPEKDTGMLKVKVVGSNALGKHGIEGYVKVTDVISYIIPN